jgi:hypothetical protein
MQEFVSKLPWHRDSRDKDGVQSLRAHCIEHSVPDVAILSFASCLRLEVSRGLKSKLSAVRSFCIDIITDCFQHAFILKTI